MAADNSLSNDAFIDIEKIQKGYTEKGVNMIVFIDPADDLPHILKIDHRGKKRIKTYPEFNSVDTEQMRQVLNDIAEMYPAASYGLVLWSHGTSWLPAGMQLRSFGEDKGCQMDITNLAAALPIKFSFLLFDACLMGSVEVVYELRNNTDYIIASPTEVIYLGFPYETIIPELLQEKQNLKKVTASYFNYYDQQTFAYRSASISLINTKELEPLALITNQLISSQTIDIETFDRMSVQRLDVYEEQYTFDFFDFIEKAFPDSDTGLLREQLGTVIPNSE
jgi:hypothetical protein